MWVGARGRDGRRESEEKKNSHGMGGGGEGPMGFWWKLRRYCYGGTESNGL